jgi:hypothetical protein
VNAERIAVLEEVAGMVDAKIERYRSPAVRSVLKELRRELSDLVETADVARRQTGPS